MKYDIVFEGGGAKGFAYVGVLNVLDKKGIKINRALGTSAGAIVAALVKLGYTAKEVEALLAEQKNGKSVFNYFMDVKKEISYESFKNSVTMWFLNHLFFLGFLIPCISWVLYKVLNLFKTYRMVFSFIEHGGLYSGDFFTEWMEDKVRRKFPDFPWLTFKQLYDLTGADLSVIASDIDEKHKEQLVLNHRTSPNLPVSWAVRMSMSIPFIYTSVNWKPEWGTYCNRPKVGHEIVDGGVMSNFALDMLFDSHPILMGDISNANPVGLLLDDTTPFEFIEDPVVFFSGIIQKSKIVSRINKVIETMLSTDNMTIFKYKKYVCELPVKGCSMLEFDIADEKKLAMTYHSEKVFEAYLNTRHN